MCECRGCVKKTWEIEGLLVRLNDMSKELHMEKKRSTELCNTLQVIYGTAREKMWYPCSFEEHEAVDADQMKYTGESVTQ